MFRRLFKKLNTETAMSKEGTEKDQIKIKSYHSTTTGDSYGSSGLSIVRSLSPARHRSNSSTDPAGKNSKQSTSLLSAEQISSGNFKVEQLKAFDTCVEACDELAATSALGGRMDSTTGLTDCSVLVSADGELLIIPQAQAQQQSKDANPTNSRYREEESSSTSTSENPPKYARIQEILKQSATELGNEYESAIFFGNDLDTSGDMALNGFGSHGWSIPASSLALRQTSDILQDFADFCEDLVLTKKSTAASENQMLNRLRPMVEGPEHGGLRVIEYNQYLKDTYSQTPIEILPSRVGPLSSPGGSIQASVVALENYYSFIAESDSRRWKLMASSSGPLAKLRATKERTDQRILNREAALLETQQRIQTMENQLALCKQDAATKWDQVRDAEEHVTKLVEEKIAERSRLREKQRLEQLEEEEATRAKNAENLGATSSEIWDIVSAVAESMEEGSFEPMDLPTNALSPPLDQSRGETVATGPFKDNSPDEDTLLTLPIASRHELEEECRLPELRATALTADESIVDAAGSLLKALSNWDMTNRSARLAAEGCLADACNAQAGCLRAIVKTEREALTERLQKLEELERIANTIDTRADVHRYITLDKQEAGGHSFMGDDDDGGVASAMAILNNHIDGNMYMGTDDKTALHNSSSDCAESSHGLTVDLVEDSVEKFFINNPLLREDAPDNDQTTNARKDFEAVVEKLCKLGKEKASSTRPLRSTMCYSLNSKRDGYPKIPTEIQFDGLCRVFSAILSGCDTSNSSTSLAKMLMSLSQCFSFVQADLREVSVKATLRGHGYWQNQEFW